MRILPDVLKELARHVPSVLFQTVEWGQLTSELPKISRRIIKKEGFQELFDSEKEKFRQFKIELTQAPLKHHQLSGKQILSLYYAQLFSPKGLFLDLRPNHFSMEDSTLKFHPSPLWTQFDETFRLGLLKVYDGFYLSNDDLYYEGLEQIGLIKAEWPLEDKTQLGDLFRSHFGDALSSNMVFKLDNFKNSIIKMSDFMLSKKVKISKDFLYLGIYLVTLYASLEETQAALPVNAIYLDVKEKMSSFTT